MSTSRAAYTLAPGELDAARAALHKALETFRVSKAEERLFKALRLSLRITAVAFAVTLTLLILDLSLLPQNQTATIGTAVEIVGGLGLFVCALGSVTVPILLALNWRIVVNAFRQRRLLKRLGLEEMSREAWKARHRRTFRDRVGKRAAAVVLGVILFVVASALILASGSSALELALQALALIVALTYPVWGFVERMRQRMTVALDAQHALTALDKTDASGDGIVVPAAVLEKAAQIEHTQIAAERAHAIAARATEPRDYALLTTRDVTAQKASLPAAQRLELEELIEEVVAKPTAWPAGVEAGGEIRRARTNDGAIEVDYVIDEAARTVRVVGCRGFAAPAVGV